MKRKQIITLVHDILGFIHSGVISLIACQFLPLYLTNPSGSLTDTNYQILKNSMFFTIGYYVLNFMFILFLEPYKKRIIQNTIIDIMSISIPFILLLNQRFTNVIGSLSIMEFSTMILYLRSILWDLKIKNRMIMDTLYMGCFILCRFVIPYYMIYCLVRSYPTHMNDTMYMEVLSFLFATLIVNLLQFMKLTQSMSSLRSI